MSDDADAVLARVYARLALFDTLPAARVVWRELQEMARSTEHHDIGLATIVIGARVGVLMHMFEPPQPDFQARLETVLARGDIVTPDPELVQAYSIRRARQIVEGQYVERADGMFDMDRPNAMRLVGSDGTDRAAPPGLLEKVLPPEARGES